MKKLLLSALLVGGVLGMKAQEFPAQKKSYDMHTWYHMDFDKTGVYGVNTEGAYKFLDSKGLKPHPVIVAVIDSGVEVDHPGLKPNMWVNAKEIPNNGIDDDKNGYVDDIHGWNFIGGKNGDVKEDNLEATRVVRQYKPLFESADAAANEANRKKMSKEYAMYQQALKDFTEGKAKAEGNYRNIERVYNLIPVMGNLLGSKPLTSETLSGIKPKTQEEAMSLQILSNVMQDPEMKGKDGKEVVASLKKEIQGAYDHYRSQALFHYNLEFDPRNIVGDNYEDLSQKYYGNNHYEGPDALHGTHVAGIIAGVPNHGEKQYGVASKVAKIMTVRAVPDGDERDKDVANAIRYAVDNGAKVINMSFGKGFSTHPEAVWDAFKYAESKGVTLVHAAGNDNSDIQLKPNFPTNFKNENDAKAMVTNVITVGANTDDVTALRADFSNFNKKMVDVFAPGNEIYSTVPDGKYQMLQGTSMASPVVAGAAAVLKSYMPNLTPEQIITSLVKTVNISHVKGSAGDNTDIAFDQLSVSGGVIDVKKAAEYAYKNYYTAGNSALSEKKNKRRK